MIGDLSSHVWSLARANSSDLNEYNHRNLIANSSVKRWPWPFLLQHFKHCIGNRSPTNRESWTSFNFPDQSPTLYDCRRCPYDFLRLAYTQKIGNHSATVGDCRRLSKDSVWTRLKGPLRSENNNPWICSNMQVFIKSWWFIEQFSLFRSLLLRKNRSGEAALLQWMSLSGIGVFRWFYSHRWRHRKSRWPVL